LSIFIIGYRIPGVISLMVNDSPFSSPVAAFHSYE